MPEIPTAAGQWCKHACERGCGIYETRPEPCRAFECAWLTDAGGVLFREDERPDKIGAVFIGYQSEWEGTIENWFYALIHPIQTRERAERTIERVARNLPVMRRQGAVEVLIASHALAQKSGFVQRVRAAAAGVTPARARPLPPPASGGEPA